MVWGVVVGEGAGEDGADPGLVVGAVVGEGSLVAAGTVILEGTHIPPRSLVAGVPGKVRRQLDEDEYQKVILNARAYLELAAGHREVLRGRP